MTEIWKPIQGYETRYEVSSAGRIRTVSFRQRFVHWRTGGEMFRTTPVKLLSQNEINSGYLIAHLYLDGKRKALLVHRLVGIAFLGEPGDRMTNHKNGNKQDNRAENLEWVTDTENKVHAVGLGLNTQAIPVIDPSTGERFGSITQARQTLRIPRRVIETTFIREQNNV